MTTGPICCFCDEPATHCGNMLCAAHAESPITAKDREKERVERCRVRWADMTAREVFKALKVAPKVAGPWAPHDGYGSKAAARFDPYGVIVLFDRGTGWGVSSFAPKDPFDDEEQFDTRKDADERLREIGWLLCDEEPASSPASGTDAPAKVES